LRTKKTTKDDLNASILNQVQGKCGLFQRKTPTKSIPIYVLLPKTQIGGRIYRFRGHMIMAWEA